MTTNRDRAGWAAKALRAHSQAVGNHEEGPETILSDLLGDLLHWCNSMNIQFDSALLVAESNYAEEVAEERAELAADLGVGGARP
jgi:hypothetical protein